MDFDHFGSVGGRSPVAGKAGLIGFDHYRIAQDHGYRLGTATHGDRLPRFVSPGFRERDSSWNFDGVLILLRYRQRRHYRQTQSYIHRNSDRFISHVQSPCCSRSFKLPYANSPDCSATMYLAHQ